MKFPSLRRTARPVVALAWDQHELLAAVARPTTGGFRLQNAFYLPIEAGTTVVDAAAELAQQLKRQGIHAFRLVVGLPRSHVDMLTLQLPRATEAELPELVRNEVLRQLSDLPEESPIDYWLPAGDSTESTLTVEAAALRGETHDLVQALCAQLRQPPAQIVIRSLAIAKLFVRQVKQLPPRSLLLNLLQSTADLSVLADRRIIFTRTVQLTANHEQQPDVAHLADEIRRTLFVAPHVAAQANDGHDDSDERGGVQHVYMFADLERNSPFVERLAEELQLTVSLLDPLAGIELSERGRPEGTHRYAALIGMIWNLLEGDSPLDLAHPKRSPAPPQRGRRVAAYATVAVMGLALAGWVLRRDVNAARAQVESLTADVQHQQALLKKLRSQTAVLDAVERWQQADANWLDELRRLSEQMPAADQAVVQRITMAPSAGARGIISMSVRVRHPSIVEQLEQQLRDASHQVSSQRISQSGSDQAYPTQFETSLVLMSPTPTRIATSPSAQR
jgi:hypothetical protein